MVKLSIFMSCLLFCTFAFAEAEPVEQPSSEVSVTKQCTKDKDKLFQDLTGIKPVDIEVAQRWGCIQRGPEGLSCEACRGCWQD